MTRELTLGQPQEISTGGFRIIPDRPEKSKQTTNSEKSSSIEKYLPEGYPQFLFSGTSINNADSVIEKGLAVGTLSPNIILCLDERFYRGFLIIAKNDRSLFKTNPPNKWGSHLHYEVKPKTGKRRTIQFNYIDTDNVPGTTKITTDKHVSSMALSVISITKEQKSFINELDSVLSYNLVENVRVFSSDAPSKYERSINERRIKQAEFLGIDIASFQSKEAYQKAIYGKHKKEQSFIESLIQKKFPSAIKWKHNGLNLSDKDIVTSIILQLHQSNIVTEILGILNDYDTPEFLEFPEGNSIKGLNELRKQKQQQMSQ